MSAFNPLTSRDIAGERSSDEPSMEEILASIRRIISDDQSSSVSHENGRAENRPVLAAEAPVVSTPPRWPYADSPQEAVRSKDSEMLTPRRILPDQEPERRGSGEAYFKPADGDSKSLFSRQKGAKPADPAPSEYAMMERRRGSNEELDSPAAPPKFRRGEPAFEIHEQDEEVPIVSPSTDAAVASSFNTLFASQLLPTSEMLAELAREMLRPMLKTWLDDNLPVMVERLVRAEIERVARGGR